MIALEPFVLDALHQKNTAKSETLDKKDLNNFVSLHCSKKLEVKKNK